MRSFILLIVLPIAGAALAQGVPPGGDPPIVGIYRTLLDEANHRTAQEAAQIQDLQREVAELQAKLKPADAPAKPAAPLGSASPMK